jgi:hypothetical protein
VKSGEIAVTKHVSDRAAGIHRKRPHLVRHGRSALHPGEFEPPPTRKKHPDENLAHDLSVMRQRAEHQAKHSHGHKKSGRARKR